MPAQTSLTGGGVRIANNGALTNLNGLQNIDSTNINIDGNDALTDISAIKDIYIYTYKPSLYIENNPLLEMCALPNVCAYLQGPGSRIIENNASGCNSDTEILAQCPVHTNSPSVFPGKIYPVPAATHIIIELPEAYTAQYVELYNTLGRKVLDVYNYRAEKRIDISDLPSGVYFVKITIKDKKFIQKIILE